MSKLRIGVDVDDVVYDVYNKIVPMLLQSFNIDKGQFNNGNLDYFDIDNDTYRQYLDDHFKQFVNELEVKNNCAETLLKMKQSGLEIVFITARSDDVLGDAYQITKRSLDRDGIVYDKIITNAQDKGLACMVEKIDIFIDDSIKHTQRVSLLGIDTLIFDMPYNQHINIKRVNNWEQIYEYIMSKNSR